MSTLQSEIEQLWERYQHGLTAADAGEPERATIEAALDALQAGEIRAAEKRGPEVTDWEPVPWVKQAVLLAFGLRETRRLEYGGVGYHDVLPVQETTQLGERGTRNTPDGTVVRRGAHVGSDCILMSPSFLNVGCRVGDGTLVDSCDTVGSCAQIGTNVKLGANTTIGGVLEPIEDAPVVIEDDVSLGAGCRVTSGFCVGEGAVVGENTLLSPNVPVYDLVAEEIHYGHLPAGRRAFTRFVESSLSDHPLFDGGAYKPAVVATDPDGETLEATRREEVLRE